MKTIRILLIIVIPFLHGCPAYLAVPLIATGGALAKLGLGAKPEMYYEVEGEKIIIDVSSYSANLASIKNMTEVGAVMLADEAIGCTTLALQYAKWPNNLFAAAIRIKTTVEYECTAESIKGTTAAQIGLVGSLVDVKRKLRYEQDLVKVVRQYQLLKPKGGDITSISDIDEDSSNSLYSNPIGEDTADQDLVKKIQNLLKENGYSISSADGINGIETSLAIKEFQLDNDMDINGVPTVALLEALENK